MGQSTVVATAFTAIMFVAGVSILIMSVVSGFGTLSEAMTSQVEQRDILLNERIEFGSWSLDSTNLLRINITNTGSTTMMLNDFENVDLIVSLNNGSETTRWVDFDTSQKGWLSGWGQRVKLTIDATDVDSDLSSFPVLVYLSTSSGRNDDDVSFVFDELQNDANRQKIAVTTSDGVTQCYVEIEEWDDASEEAWLWVKVPLVDDTVDTELFFYYDAGHLDNTAYVGDPNSSPAEAVWGSDFMLVSHMEDDPDTSHIRDSTVYDNDGTKVSANEPIETASGNISYAQDFVGVDDYVDLGSDSSLDLRGSDFTIEAWIYPRTQSVNWPTIYSVGEWEISLGIGQDTNTDKLEVWVDDNDDYASISDVTYNAWNYVVLSWDGSNYDFYIDGQPDGSYAGSAYTQTGITYIGGIPPWENEDCFNGVIDEVRTSNVSRSDAWISASFENGRDDLIDYGSEVATTDQGGVSTDYLCINRVFFRDSEGDLINPMRLTDPIHGGWDPLETIEIVISLVDVAPTIEYLTFITPNGVQAHSALTEEEDNDDLDYGQVTILSSETIVTVNHDLGKVPVNIQVTAGGQYEDFLWTRDWNSTSFVIELTNSPDADTVFFWQVR